MLNEPISGQLAELGLSLAMGAGLGLLYDVFRALRRRTGARAGAVLDALFALSAAFMLFAFGMGPGEGSVQVFTVIFAALGLAAYMAAVSPPVLKALLFVSDAASRGLSFASAPMKKAAEKIGKSKKISRNVFTKSKKWFTITKVVMSNHRRQTETGGKPGEAEKIQRHHEDRYIGPDNLRGSELYIRPQQDGGGSAGKDRPSAEGHTDVGGKRRTPVRHRSQHRRSDH
jgi:hypothetical protein